MIKRKRDIPKFLKNFVTFATWDGTKHYLTIDDTTLMLYDDGSFTYYRKKERFWDLKEIELEPEELQEFLWDNRKEINKKVVTYTS